MSFNITLTYNYSDPKVLGKTLGMNSETPVMSVVSVRPTDSVDVLNPVFVIDYNDAYLNYNYVYCEKFRRYYFINNRQVDIGSKITLYCSVDVLESYRGAILGGTGNIIRSGAYGTPTNIPDKLYPIDPNRKEMKTQLLTGGFDFAPQYSGYNIICRVAKYLTNE